MSDGADVLGMAGQTAEVETPIIDTPVETPELESQEPIGEEQIPEREEAEESKPAKSDARLLPKDVQRLLKQLRDADPANAALVKQLQDSYFREQAYSKVGKVEEIQGLKSKIEELGGDEGISTLRASAELLEKLDQDYEQGNPEVLNDIPEEGFKKLVGPALDKLERMDPKTFGNTIRPHLISALESARFPDAMNMVRYFLSKGDAQEAIKHLDSIDQWFIDQKNQSGEISRGMNDPKLADLERREQALKTQEENSFRSRIGEDIVGKMNSEIGKIVESDAYKGLTQGQKKHFAQGIFQGVEAILRGDKNYQTNVRAAISNRDAGRLTNYVNSQVGAVIGRVARQLKNDLFPNLGAASPSGKTAASTSARKPTAESTTATAVGSKPLMLPSSPDEKDIDYSKTNMTMRIAHKVFLKNGKFVTWK